MIVHQLHIHSLRNIQNAQLTLNSSFNVLLGPNGSGKTTFLEALYLLSAGFSFRTRETSPIVRYGDSSLVLFARTFENDSIAIRKTISGPTQVQLNSSPCSNSSVLARFIPCQVFYQDIFQIIDAGPSVRRSLLDWGVFHVKHEYHELWKGYRHVLKQRNALLRQHPSRKEIRPWDLQLVQLSMELDQLRQSYFMEWNALFKIYLSQLSEIECSIEYYRGWKDRGKDLLDILEEQYLSDCQRQYTQSGAHQADIRIVTPHISAKQGLSRGQQKTVLIALKLAQGHQLGEKCLYLFDDLTSELDFEHIQRIILCLKKVKGQKIVTALDLMLYQHLLHEMEFASFHIENGVIIEKPWESTRWLNQTAVVELLQPE